MISLSSIVRRILSEAQSRPSVTPRKLALAVHARQLLLELEEKTGRTIPSSLDRYTTVVGRRLVGSASEDYYEVLGVSRTASRQQIDQAYNNLMMGLNPNVNPTASAAVMRSKVQDAAKILLSADLRRLYDEGLPLPAERGTAVALPADVLGTEPDQNDLELLRRKYPTISSLARAFQVGFAHDDPDFNNEDDMEVLGAYRDELESGRPQTMAAAAARRVMRRQGRSPDEEQQILSKIEKMLMLSTWPLSAMYAGSAQYEEDFFPMSLVSAIVTPRSRSLESEETPYIERSSSRASDAGASARSVRDAANAVKASLDVLRSIDLSDAARREVDDYVQIVRSLADEIARNVRSGPSRMREAAEPELDFSALLAGDEDDDPMAVHSILTGAYGSTGRSEEPEPSPSAEPTLSPEEIDQMEEAVMDAVEQLDSAVTASAINSPVVYQHLQELQDAVTTLFDVVRTRTSGEDL